MALWGGRAVRCVLRQVMRTDLIAGGAAQWPESSKKWTSFNGIHVPIRLKKSQQITSAQLLYANRILYRVGRPSLSYTNSSEETRREKRSAIVSFDKKLRFKVILAVISCHKRINVNAFKEYCYTTAEIYIKLYKWYPLPPSIHILLIHGHKIIESLPLPIGILSEEALEANHKNVKRFRDKFTRKDSRIHTNTDLFNRLLMSSNPLVSMCRNTKERKKHDYTQEMRNLILETDGTETLEYESENDVDESEEES
uniref:Uncharacterized protein n=1 Tax=Trichogramma kaykai TaxID=54128 RepID=A0ABD2W5C9_9HYME